MKNGETHPVSARHIATDNPVNRQLLEEVQTCTLCERMTCSRRVLSDLNGDWDAPVLFVAEAPGRLGAEKTGIPLFGDRTGDRFELLLCEMGLARNEVFITNVVRCRPPGKIMISEAPRSGLQKSWFCPIWV